MKDVAENLFGDCKNLFKESNNMTDTLSALISLSDHNFEEKDIALNDIKVGQRYTVTITSYRALFPTGSFRGTFEGGRQDSNQQRHFHFSTTTTELPRPNAPISISIPEWEIQRVQQYNIAPHITCHHTPP